MTNRRSPLMDPEDCAAHRKGPEQPTEEREQMAWFVHYWNEIDNRNVCSSEISAREDANAESV